MYDDYFGANLGLWNGWTKLHTKSAFYDVAGFKAGRTSLMPVELEALGDVSGKSLLHLQCHFGMDTLSWARMGAQVTGIDMSNEAINTADSLSNEIDVEAQFICTNIYELPGVLEGQFDIVFTSYGVLEWLPDLDGWAEIVAHYLKPGGVFLIVEFHPMFWMLDDETGQRLVYRYFKDQQPERWVEKGSYADLEADFVHESYVWTHSLGEIVTALAGAGLRIEYLREFPFSPYNIHPKMEEVEAGRYIVSGHSVDIPLLFSLRATR